MFNVGCVCMVRKLSDMYMCKDAETSRTFFSPNKKTLEHPKTIPASPHNCAARKRLDLNKSRRSRGGTLPKRVGKLQPTFKTAPVPEEVSDKVLGRSQK